MRENNPLNQEILYNYGTLQDVFDLLNRYDHGPEDDEDITTQKGKNEVGFTLQQSSGVYSAASLRSP